MPTRPFNGGALQTAKASSIMAGGTLRRVKAVKMMVEGSLVTVFNGATSGGGGALSVSGPSAVSGTAYGNRPRRVTSNAATATPTGGSAPYSYSWTIEGGDIVADSPSSATTTFSAIVFNDTVSATAQCVVTDAFGATGTLSLTVQLTQGPA